MDIFGAMIIFMAVAMIVGAIVMWVKIGRLNKN
jgi:hypothetical protein